jgi:hypothetical protein
MIEHVPEISSLMGNSIIFEMVEKWLVSANVYLKCTF